MTESHVQKPAELMKERAYRKIHEAILNETFHPGAFLSERRLIEFLGMSKTPIKSALDRLESEGFVQVSPKQGILVKDLAIDKVRDIFELRMVLELHICGQLAGRLKPHEADLLEHNLARQKQTADEEDEPGFTRSDSEFHLLLSRFSGNAEIHAVMTMYQAHLYRFALRIIRRVPNRMQAAYRDHLDIFRALADGDEEKCRRLIREHLAFGKGVLTN
ncbi:GntR family transcriptional regulator [Cohnella sp. GCM10020058]|uniref:GntR family transcriptional regulator n=1 Tax=Cohnella sp. GCM10020058 TaxID=3317330 RepID=UPI00363896B1